MTIRSPCGRPQEPVHGDDAQLSAAGPTRFVSASPSTVPTSSSAPIAAFDAAMAGRHRSKPGARSHRYAERRQHHRRPRTSSWFGRRPAFYQRHTLPAEERDGIARQSASNPPRAAKYRAVRTVRVGRWTGSMRRRPGDRLRRLGQARRGRTAWPVCSARSTTMPRQIGQGESNSRPSACRPSTALARRLCAAADRRPLTLRRLPANGPLVRGSCDSSLPPGKS